MWSLPGILISSVRTSFSLGEKIIGCRSGSFERLNRTPLLCQRAGPRKYIRDISIA